MAQGTVTAVVIVILIGERGPGRGEAAKRRAQLQYQRSKTEQQSWWALTCLVTDMASLP